MQIESVVITIGAFLLGIFIGGIVGVAFMCLFQINIPYERDEDKISAERSGNVEKT
jgi:hypothetical protein